MQWQVLTVDRLSKDVLTALMYNEAAAVRVPRFVLELDRRAFRCKMEYSHFQPYKDLNPPMYRVGITQFEHKDDPSMYFDKVPSENAARRSLFPHGKDPLERVRFLLGEAWGSCVDPAESTTGYVYFAGLIRNLEEALPHADWAPQDAPGWSIGTVTAQLAWNAYYSTATLGGKLKIYDRPWTPDLENHRIPNTYGYDWHALGTARQAIVVPEAGDLIVFNSRNIHEVSRCNGEIPRVTVGSFVGLLPEGRLVVWSSGSRQSRVG